jgi:hypothetical protein
MDWAQVTSVAITGAVGVVGVAGTIIAARMAGKSTMQGVRLTIGAEDRRARLADKRRVYARAIAALDASVTATRTERAAYPDLPGHRTYEVAAKAALMAAADAMGELQLAAPPRIADLARGAASDLDLYQRHKLDDERIRETRQSLLDALRADFDEAAPQGD